jgi:hypothetical protein
VGPLDGFRIRKKQTRRYPCGSIIVGPSGENIGVWYFIYRWTTLQLKVDKRVSVFPTGVEDPMDGGRNRLNRRMD